MFTNVSVQWFNEANRLVYEPNNSVVIIGLSITEHDRIYFSSVAAT